MKTLETALGFRTIFCKPLASLARNISLKQTPIEFYSVEYKIEGII